MALSSYNNSQYNQSEYDQGALLLILSDVQTSTDAKTNSDSTTRTEAVTLTLVLYSLFTQAAQTESVSLSDATTMEEFLTKVESISSVDSHLISLFRTLIDSLTPSDLALMQSIKTLSDSSGVTDVVTTDDQMAKAEIMTVTDALQPFVMGKPLADSITLADLRAFSQSHSFSDFSFMIDLLTKQVTGKTFNDILQVNTWLELRKEAVNIWTSLL